MKALVIGVAVMVLCSAAMAAAALPAKTVNVQVRKQALLDAHRFPNAKVACAWSARTVTYQCTVWAPSPGSSTIVQGVPGKVFITRSAQACGKLWSTSDPSKGCRTTTTKPTCWFRMGQSVSMLNVCRVGWQKRLATG